MKRASEDGMTDQGVCDDLGISVRQLRRWRDQYRLLGDEAFPGQILLTHLGSLETNPNITGRQNGWSVGSALNVAHLWSYGIRPDLGSQSVASTTQKTSHLRVIAASRAKSLGLRSTTIYPAEKQKMIHLLSPLPKAQMIVWASADVALSRTAQ